MDDFAEQLLLFVGVITAFVGFVYAWYKVYTNRHL
jgi:hypothetical protein